MLDFSQAPHTPPAPQDDTEALRRYLVDTLETWLPRLLPGGHSAHGEFRAGSINGEPGGSLCMRLRGDSRGLWTDHSTGQGGDPFNLLMECLGCDFQTAIAQARDMAGLKMRPTPKALTRPRSPDADARLIRDILSETSAEAYIVQQYLAARDITLPVPPDLLAHARLWHGPSASPHPAMVGRVRDVAGRVIGVHRTFLAFSAVRSVWEKAPICPQKMMLGRCKGGSVHLAESAELMGVSEGIESGLSAMQLFGMPVWAALSTSGMRAIELPAHVQQVAIFADFDAVDKNAGGRPGTMAAEALADRLTAEGKDARVIYPMHELGDFNEELRERGG
jgi:putative DNA primase/helicase